MFNITLDVYFITLSIAGEVCACLKAGGETFLACHPNLAENSPNDCFGMLEILFNPDYGEALKNGENFYRISDRLSAKNSHFSKPRFDRDSVKLWKGEENMIFISAITERSVIEIYFFNQESSTVYNVGPLFWKTLV